MVRFKCIFESITRILGAMIIVFVVFIPYSIGTTVMVNHDTSSKTSNETGVFKLSNKGTLEEDERRLEAMKMADIAYNKGNKYKIKKDLNKAGLKDAEVRMVCSKVFSKVLERANIVEQSYKNGTKQLFYNIASDAIDYKFEYNPYIGKKFSKESWIEADKKYKESYGISGQCAIYQDLITNHLKKGMALKMVEDLLGDDGLKYYCLGNRKVKCVYYSLGLCYANSWTRSGGTITICFNEKHEAIDYGHDDSMDNKYCSKGSIYCEGKPQCTCYPPSKLYESHMVGKGFFKGDKLIAKEECDFEVERW